MEWKLEEALAYYKKQGAPSDQNALLGLLREIQEENGGSIPLRFLNEICQGYGIRQTYLEAIIRRFPRLRLASCHCLEICNGPNCPKKAGLAAFAQKNYEGKIPNLQIKYTGCMRMCGKGPNIKWDGQIYHRATESLIRQLISENMKKN